jgi:hypothetical protein
LINRKKSSEQLAFHHSQFDLIDINSFDRHVRENISKKEKSYSTKHRKEINLRVYPYENDEY